MQTNRGYSQSLPLTWLQSPEERDRRALLEYVRGVVYSLSTSKEGRIKEVHVSRVRNSFAKLGEPNLYRLGLKLLSLLREVEPLFDGYWLLAPFRIVEVEGRFLFVGAVPSALGHVGDVAIEGLGRFVTEDVARRFPQQSIEGWMGIGPIALTSLIAFFRRDHLDKAAATINVSDIEYLKVVENGPWWGRRFAWVPRAHSVLDDDDQIAVCRQKHGGSYRYFSAGLRSGKVITEAPIEQSLSRLTYAIAYCAGISVVARVQQEASVTEVTITERLPTQEYRLALVLSRSIIRRGNCTTYALASHLAPAFLKRLTDLGCALETSK